MTTPTLIIGLGGTGRQTLMQIRRLFLEDDPYFVPREGDARDAYRQRYPAGRVPHVELLSIDTDDRLLDLSGEAYDPVLRAAALSGSEVLDIKIVSEKVKALYQQRNAHPHYRDWYDFSLEASGIPEHGCGQTRPWGRLAFFHNQGEIAGAIKSAVERLLGPDTSRAAQTINVTLNKSTIKVQLVFSVAGGTGSGMFLDTAFQVRKILEEFSGVTLILEGVILLPSAFSNDPRHRVFANAYAAFMEIEYYNRKREDSSKEGWFPILWESVYSGRGPAPRIVGPTFSMAWLIGNVSRGSSKTKLGTRLGIEKEDKNALTAMIAEWLYLRCSPVSETFGNEINSYLVSNALPLEFSASARLEVYEGVEARIAVDGGFDFSRRFGSFGVAKMHAPSSLGQERLAHRLVADLVADWLQEPKLEEGVTNAARAEARAALNLSSDADALDSDGNPMDADVFALSRSIEHASVGQSLLTVAGEEIDKERSRVAGVDDPDRFENRFMEWRRAFRAKFIADEDPVDSQKGDFARAILSFAAQRRERDAETLDRLITRYLGQQGRGFGHAREILTSLRNDYDRVLAEAPASRDNEADATRDFSDRVNRTMGMFRPSQSTFVRETIARVCFKRQRDSFLAECGRQIYDATIALAAAQSKLVSARLKDLDQLELNLRRLQTELAQTAAKLSQRPHSKLDMLVATAAEDRYRTEEGRQLAAPENRWALSRGSPAPEGPWPIRQHLAGAALGRFRGDMLAFAKDRLDHVLRHRASVLTIFDQDKTDDAEYQKALQPLIDNATSWIDVRHEESRTWQAGQPMGVSRYAVREGDQDERDRLRDQLNQLGFGTGATRVDQLTGPIDQLIFEEHLTGVPLFEVASLKSFRDLAYEPIMAGVTEGIGEFTNAALHLEQDIDKYDDLLKPNADEAKRSLLAMRLFIRGLVTGVFALRHDERTGSIIFGYNKDVGLRPRLTEMGAHPRVLRLLARDQSPQAADLEPMIQDAEHRLWEEGPQRRAQILALLDYYATNAEHPVAGNRRFRRVAEQLLQETRERADPHSIDLARNDAIQTLDSWARETPPGSRYRRLPL